MGCRVYLFLLSILGQKIGVAKNRKNRSREWELGFVWFAFWFGSSLYRHGCIQTEKIRIKGREARKSVF